MECDDKKWNRSTIQGDWYTIIYNLIFVECTVIAKYQHIFQILCQKQFGLMVLNNFDV